MLKSIPYKTKLRTIHIPGQAPLEIFTLLDKQQFYDPKGAAERLGICSAAWPLFGMLWPSGLQSPDHVAQYIHAHAQACSEVWVMDPNRGYRNRFTRKMSEYGFRLAEDKKIHRPYAFNNNDVPESYSGRFLHYQRDINPSLL
ncbi:hypothetical protein ACM5Q9_02520 [Advenella sp. RU8]|uniref:hypothetical protein n=1 Tax=Advenella sp. RU8 TaxID=3399575 RepID=UPI003AB0C70F